MPRRFRAPLLPSFLVLAAVATAAAGCDRVIADPHVGELLAAYDAEDGSTAWSRDARYDLGQVWIGAAIQREVTLRNAGPGALSVARIEVVENEAEVESVSVRVSGLPGAIDREVEDPLWHVEWTGPSRVLQGHVARMQVRFTPAETATIPVTRTLHLRLHLEGAREGENTVNLRFSAEALPGRCDVPKTLSFGTVIRGDQAHQELLFRNLDLASTVLTVTELTGPDATRTAFRADPGSSAGQYALAPFEERTVGFTFVPEGLGVHTANVTIVAATGCSPQTVTLSGVAVDAQLTWTPPQLDCGYVSPGAVVLRDVTFHNAGETEVRVRELRSQNVTEFALVSPSELTVPPHGTGTVTVAFRPSTLGPRQSFLTFTTDLPRQPMGQVMLRCFGGGPDIQVTPFPTLNFGRVAFIPGASSPPSSTRKLTVMNVGTMPATPDVRSNLRLGTPDENGEPTQPYAIVSPTDPNTAPSEFEVTVPQTYDGVKGLVAKVGENAVELRVRLTPESAGPKKARITIFSNDLDEPEVHIDVSATAEILTHCDYEVSTQQLGFGLLEPGQQRELAIRFTNKSADPLHECLVTSPELSPGSDGAFSLPDATASAQVSVTGGQSVQFLVRVDAPHVAGGASASFQGAVRFYVSSMLKPQVEIPLYAEAGETCFEFSPALVDFGTVRTTCASEPRTVRVYNRCPQAATFHALGLSSTTAQGEFEWVTPPPSPLVVDPAQPPLELEVRFRPQREGLATGLILATGTSAGSSVTYGGPSLKARASATGLHTDSFVNPLKPKVDVLIVLDATGGTEWYRQLVANAFDDFMLEAQQTGADYQLGVILADTGMAATNGRLIHGPTHPERILTPLTANAAVKFSAKMQVATQGNPQQRCVEPALLALGHPLRHTDNAGFLRPDAALSIICVQEQHDWSTAPATELLDRLWNVQGHHRKTDFRFNAIAAIASPTAAPICFPQPGQGAPDPRMLHLTAQTDGVARDLCDPDYASHFGAMGQRTFSAPERYFLTSRPDLAVSAPEVRVDGMIVPSTSSTGAAVWTYDPVRNVLHFAPATSPEPGRTVSVTYPSTCH